MKKLNLLLFASLLLGFTNCQKSNEPILMNNIHEVNGIENGTNYSTQLVLGKHLENPYSVKNMKKAYESLPSSTRGYIDSQTEDIIYTTHLYIKFKPKTKEEEWLLESDTTVNFYPYPLDYEILSYGQYKDPQVPEDQPTYLYAAIEIDHTLPTNIEYEILEELYIPDDYSHDKIQKTRTTSGLILSREFTQCLVNKSLELTNNLDEKDSNSSTRSIDNEWIPQGYITYYDDVLNQNRGVEGIRVDVRRWFTTHTGFVNSSGYYKCDGDFYGSADYTFDLERHEFEVEGDKVQTSYGSDSRKSAWNYHFTRNIANENYLALTAFRAAFHYYYKDINGLQRPPMNGFWNGKLDIDVHYENKDPTNGTFEYFSGVYKKIHIYNNSHLTYEEYATVIHEISHAAHWAKDKSLMNDIENKVKESWARGVQWYLTRMVYPNYKGAECYDTYPDYTNIIIDLIDHEVDDTNNHGKSKIEGDEYFGMSIGHIEFALKECKTWDQWKNNIKGGNNEENQQKIEKLFSVW